MHWPVLLGCLALLGCAGCSLLLDTDSLTAANGGAGTGGMSAGQGNTGSVGIGASGQGNGGSVGQGEAGAAGQGAADCGTEAASSCDGLDANCRATLDEPNCPAGCHGVVLNGTSYMACAPGVSWSDANVLCQAQGMRLIRIDDAAENNVAVELSRGLGSYVWLGGSSLLSPGSYTWPDGSEFFANGAGVDGVYQNFEPGQPVEGAGRNCVQLHDSPDGPWSNAPCSDIKPYLCERW